MIGRKTGNNMNTYIFFDNSMYRILSALFVRIVRIFLS